MVTISAINVAVFKLQKVLEDQSEPFPYSFRDFKFGKILSPFEYPKPPILLG